MVSDASDTNYDALLSLSSSEGNSLENRNVHESDTNVQLGRREPVSLSANCPSCNALGESLTAITDIPHFKEVYFVYFPYILMFCEVNNK